MRNTSWFNGKKICFIAGTLGQGGAERQLYYMASTLKEHGANVQVLCLTRGEYWEAPLRDLGVPVTLVGESSSRIVRIIRILWQLHSIQPDILQSAHFYTNLYVALAGRLLSIPAVGAMRNDCFSELADNGKFLGSLQLRLPRLIAGNSMKGIENARSLGIAAERLFFCPM